MYMYDISPDQPRSLVVRVSDYWSWGPGFDHGLGSLAEFMFKALPGTSYSYITIHRDNVTAPHGCPNLRSQLHFGHNREGRPRSP
jgi:hypothetical protein